MFYDIWGMRRRAPAKMDGLGGRRYDARSVFAADSGQVVTKFSTSSARRSG